MVQVYNEGDYWRLSLCRTEVDINLRRWKEGISWEDIQQIKTEVGLGALDAVEVYPRDVDIVNVANMRHIWVFKNRYLTFAWRGKKFPEAGDVG